jgi:hypothetical protein
VIVAAMLSALQEFLAAGAAGFDSKTNQINKKERLTYGN